jgi:hypothetical protein
MALLLLTYCASSFLWLLLHLVTALGMWAELRPCVLMMLSAHAVLQDVDLAQGLVSGSMRALDVAGAAGPIDTYFEGHIVDDVHNTFWTRTWGASREMDLRHWSKFEGFADIK